MIDVFILLPTFLAFIIGYYIIITQQYLKYDAQIGYFVFWLASVIQAAADLVNIVFDPVSTQNEVIAGYTSFGLIFFTAFVLMKKIISQNFSIKNFWEKSDPDDRKVLIIFSIFFSIFIIFEFIFDFSDESWYQWIMAVIAIVLDFSAVLLARKEIYSKICEQKLSPWILWIFSLTWLCVFEAIFSYDEGFFPPSVGWAMLCENIVIMLIIAGFIIHARMQKEKKPISWADRFLFFKIFIFYSIMFK